jgi:hypothetical protein
MRKSARSKSPVTKAKRVARNFTERLTIVEEIRLEAKNKGLDRMTMRDVIGEIGRYRSERKHKKDHASRKKRS